MYNFSLYNPTTIGESSIVASSQLSRYLNPMTSNVRRAGSANQTPYWTTTSQSPSSSFTPEPSNPLSYVTEYNFLGRHAYEPVANEEVAVSHYNIPSFTNHSSVSRSQENHLRRGCQEQQQQQQHMSHAQQPHPQAPLQGPLHIQDSYGGRSLVSPIPFPQNSSLRQNAFQVFPQAQHSNHSGSMSLDRLSPGSEQDYGHMTMAAPVAYHPSYGGYTLPTISGQSMPHIHAPLKESDMQISMVNNINVGPYSHNLVDPLYGTDPAPLQVQNDRPFKCDECPQSFNRNHDLKRHKRIHLAVKPFPCLYCDKSFSRKDALKRHILVKSCGGGMKNVGNREGDPLSPSNDLISDTPSERNSTIPRDLESTFP
ncbi:Transcriptional regulator prz1 [Erysiphe necator]|nr:Transcriptional regulator prz1 [Erysiphe necator]